MERLSIFVSHSHQDRSVADALVPALREAGADVWYDEHDLSAGDLSDEIQRQIARRPFFLVLLSKDAFASQWVKRECKWAYELAERHPNRQLLPVTAGPINRDDFSGETGWLFLHEFKRVEAPGYQPYPLAEMIERTRRLLGLTGGRAVRSHPLAMLADLSVDEALTQARALLARKQFADAMPLFRQATALDPTSFPAWFGLAESLRKQEDWQAGLEAYERARALNANSSAVWSGIALAYARLGEPGMGSAAYARTVEVAFSALAQGIRRLDRVFAEVSDRLDTTVRGRREEQRALQVRTSIHHDPLVHPVEARGQTEPLLQMQQDLIHLLGGAQAELDDVVRGALEALRLEVNDASLQALIARATRRLAQVSGQFGIVTQLIVTAHAYLDRLDDETVPGITTSTAEPDAAMSSARQRDRERQVVSEMHVILTTFSNATRSFTNDPTDSVTPGPGSSSDAETAELEAALIRITSTLHQFVAVFDQW